MERIEENSLYNDAAGRAALLADREKLCSAFHILLFGVIGLYTISDKRGGMKGYFPNDGKLQVSNIDDTNKDVSLVVKLMHEAGYLKTDMANQITRFLVKLKNKSITPKDINEDVVRSWLDGIQYTTYRPHIQVLSGIKNFHERKWSLVQLAKHFHLISRKVRELRGFSEEWKSISAGYMAFYPGIDLGVSAPVATAQVQATVQQQQATSTTPSVAPVVKSAAPAPAPRPAAPAPQVLPGATKEFYEELSKCKSTSEMQKVMDAYGVKLGDVKANQLLQPTLDNFKSLYEFSKGPWTFLSSLDNTVSLWEELGNGIFKKLGGNVQALLEMANSGILLKSLSKDVWPVVEAYIVDRAENVNNRSDLIAFNSLARTIMAAINKMGTRTLLANKPHISIPAPLASPPRRSDVVISFSSEVTFTIGDYLPKKLESLGIKYSTDSGALYFRTRMVSFSKDSWDNKMPAVYKAAFTEILSDKFEVLSDEPLWQRAQKITSWYSLKSALTGKGSDDTQRAEFIKWLNSTSGHVVKFDDDGYGAIHDEKFEPGLVSAYLGNLVRGNNSAAIKEFIVGTFGQSTTEFTYPAKTLSAIAGLASRSELLYEVVITHLMSMAITNSRYNVAISYVYSEFFVNLDVPATWVEKYDPDFKILSTYLQYRVLDLLPSSAFPRVMTELVEGRMRLHFEYIKRIIKDDNFLQYILAYASDIIDQGEYQRLIMENQSLAELVNTTKVGEMLTDTMLDKLENFLFAGANHQVDTFRVFNPLCPKLRKVMDKYLEGSVLQSAMNHKPWDFDTLWRVKATPTQFVKWIENLETQGEVEPGTGEIRRISSILDIMTTQIKEHQPDLTGTDFRAVGLRLQKTLDAMNADKKTWEKSFRENTATNIVNFISALADNTNLGVADSLFEGITNLPVRREVLEAIRTKSFFGKADAKILGDDNPIKPLVKLDSADIVKLLAVNDVVMPGDEIKVSKKTSLHDIKNMIDAEMTATLDKVEPLKVKKVEHDDEALARLSIEYDKFNRYKHGHMALKILEVFDAALPMQAAKWDAWKQEHDSFTETTPMFHGTSSTSASFILRYGFRVPTSAGAGIKVAGKMLGNGVYGSNVLDKVGQYVGDSGGGITRKRGSVGYVFEMQSQYDKWTVNLDDGRGDWASAGGVPGAGRGESATISPEWAFKDGNAQCKIYKCFKVKIIDKSEMDEMKKQYAPGVNESSIPSFSQYLEEKNGKNYFKTFIIMTGLIPVSETKFIPWEKFIASKYKDCKVYQTSRGIAVSFKSDDDMQGIWQTAEDLVNDSRSFEEFKRCLAGKA